MSHDPNEQPLMALILAQSSMISSFLGANFIHISMLVSPRDCQVLVLALVLAQLSMLTRFPAQTQANFIHISALLNPHECQIIALAPVLAQLSMTTSVGRLIHATVLLSDLCLHHFGTLGCLPFFRLILYVI